MRASSVWATSKSGDIEKADKSRHGKPQMMRSSSVWVPTTVEERADAKSDEKISMSTAKVAGRAAYLVTKKLSNSSKVFVEEPKVQKLKMEDMTIRTKLGEGGFCEVRLCEMNVGPEKGQEFVVKFLKREAMLDQTNFVLGAADLAVEAKFLATLNHPHIVKLHGVTAGSVEENVASGKECGFFIVIDKLPETLDKRIMKLTKEQEELFSKSSVLVRRSKEFKSKRKAALFDRLETALQIAQAMQYLHSKKIIFRDLKPDNVGFDDNDNIKVFDFGLAKELKDSLKISDGMYEMTGNSGSRRYMAPEVAKDENYGLSADVYSFAILLWELCALEKPYFGFSEARHNRAVVHEGERPRLDTLNTSWFPADLHDLLKSSWSPKPLARPSFDEIVTCLESMISNRVPTPQNSKANGAKNNANGKGRGSSRMKASAVWM